MDNEFEYTGLMCIADMLNKKFNYMNNLNIYDNEHNIINDLKQAINIHGSYAQALAIYLEKNNFPNDVIESNYLYSIKHDDTSGPLINLADFYKSKKMFSKMVIILNRAVLKFNDINAMVLLALYYAMNNNFGNSKKYYILAVVSDSPDKKFDLDMGIDSVELIKITELINQENLDKNNRIYNEIISLSNDRKNILIYNNKIRLFTELNYIVECGICFETKLNLNLNCGHIVCKDCYLHLIFCKCPFCRL